MDAHVRKEPITVQGLTIRPGESVLVLIDGEWISRIYDGIGTDTGHIYLVCSPFLSEKKYSPGPFPIEALRHPDVLTGIAKAIDGQ